MAAEPPAVGGRAAGDDGPVPFDPTGNPTGDVRGEDSFDVAAVHAWLVERLPELADQHLPTVSQFGGGASNLTYALDYPGRHLVLRRPPTGTKAAGAHDMSREYEIQRLLRPHFPAVPEVLDHCPAHDSPIGGEFYVMRRAEGIILRADLPAGMTINPAAANQLGLAVFDLLADLHQVDVGTAGLAGFYRGPGYVERQVTGWSRRYRNALTSDAPDGENVMSWLSEHQPADSGECLIHGDWRFDNMVLAPTDLGVRAVLDWELATVGDPLMDLGAALAYWVQADDDEIFRLFRRQPSNLAGMPSRNDIVDNYLNRTGRTLDDWRFYEVYGLFRLAVIAQQIWYRYANGQTTNPAFAQFGPAVHYLLARCARLTRND
jgi:aminoglycoside phosphotransferase (APT) family kinase protein